MKVSEFNSKPNAPPLPPNLAPDNSSAIEEYLIALLGHAQKVANSPNYRNKFKALIAGAHRPTFSLSLNYPYLVARCRVLTRAASPVRNYCKIDYTIEG